MNQIAPMSAFLMGDEARRPSSTHQVRLVEAAAFTCRFIEGLADENAVCCGAPTDGKSWCDYHRRLVFIPSQSRVR